MAEKDPRKDGRPEQEEQSSSRPRGVFGFLDQNRETTREQASVRQAASKPERQRVPGPGVKDVRSASGRIGLPSDKLSILVLEDYPDVMDTIVTNIQRYLYPGENAPGKALASEEQFYSIHGIESINIYQAATPYEALDFIGNYDRNARTFATLHERVYNEIIYGVFDVVLGHYLSGIDVLEIIKRAVPQFHALILTAQTNTDQEIARTVELADAYRKKQASLDPSKRFLLAQDIASNVNRVIEDRRRQEQMLRSKALVSTMPDLLAVVIDYYDFFTGSHSRGVTDIAMYIGEELKSGEKYAGRPDYDRDNLDLEMLGFNAVLHDIGKVVVPKRILSKTGFFSKEEEDLAQVVLDEIRHATASAPELSAEAQEQVAKWLDNAELTRDRQREIKLHGRLTDMELAVMRFHVAAGELIRDEFMPYAAKKLSDETLQEDIKRLFDGLYHHEKPDGSGYPYGLAGEDYSKLPTAAKIILCADVYHALRARRSYKKEMAHHEAIEVLRELAGADPVVNDCVDILTELPQHVVDSVNQLSSRRIARLIQRVRSKVEELGIPQPELLVADLMSSNAIDPDEYELSID